MDTIFSFCKENFQLITLFVGLLSVLVSVLAVCLEIKKKKRQKLEKTQKEQENDNDEYAEV